MSNGSKWKSSAASEPQTGNTRQLDQSKRDQYAEWASARSDIEEEQSSFLLLGRYLLRFSSLGPALISKAEQRWTSSTESQI